MNRKSERGWQKVTKHFPIGVVTKLEEHKETTIRRVHELGFTSCQISNYDDSLYTDELAEILNEQCEKYGVSIDGLWAGWPGRVIWDFNEGPDTIGLVPTKLRRERTAIIKSGADFAAKLNVKKVITHLGFVPENMHDETYVDLIPVLRDIADHCKKHGQDFLFETGQETPVTLLRIVEDIGRDNVGINLDPANLILYGKGNPVDSLIVLGQHIRGVHIKDGLYPTDGRNLGKETPLGEGHVDFPALLAKLKQLEFDGPLCIECELDDDVRLQELTRGKGRLEKWIQEL